MTAGAFRIADDFPAIAKQQRIIQLTDENPLFVVDLDKDTEENPYRMRLADAGLHAEDVLTYWNMTPAQLGKAMDVGVVSPGMERDRKPSVAQLIKDFKAVAIKLDLNGPPVFVGMDMGKEPDISTFEGYMEWQSSRTGAGGVVKVDQPKPDDAIQIDEETRDQMRRDRRYYDALINRIAPSPADWLHHQVRLAIQKAWVNSPKCKGIDVILDRASYTHLMKYVATYARLHREPLYLGARLLMYDCDDSPLIEARPRWR